VLARAPVQSRPGVVEASRPIFPACVSPELPFGPTMEEDPVVGPLAVAEDHAGVRSALRKLGVERIVATPDETGWQFEGLCNL